MDKSKKIAIILFIALIIGLPILGIVHDKIGTDAHAVVTQREITDKTGNKVDTDIILLKDYTYYSKHINSNVIVSSNNSTHNYDAYMYGDDPRVGNIKQDHFIIVPISANELDELKAAHDPELIFYYSDGTQIKKSIKF